MVEIPNKTPAAYREIYQNLRATAEKFNDTASDQAPENPDVVILQSAAGSGTFSSTGDEVKLKVDLAQNHLSVIRQSDDSYDNYFSQLELTQTEQGLKGSEKVHNDRGLTERSFLISGDQVEVLSESRDRGNRYDPAKNPQQDPRLKMELDSATDTLQYLLGPGFQS